MSFNKFNKSDGVRIILVLFIIAVVYFGFGSTLWSKLKRLEFRPPVPPATLTETPMPAITQTPSPTNTPASTSTVIATPIPVSTFLPGEIISYWNEFDKTDPLRGDWVFFSNVKVENGLLVIDHDKDWDGVYGNQHLVDGQTVLMQFRFEAWSDIHIAVETGEFETDSYRSWGVGAEAGVFSPVFSEGANEYGDSFSPDDLVLTPGEWYVIMLHIGGADPFIARIWEYNKPDNVYEVQIKMNETWQGNKWLPLILVGPEGKLEIERYEELEVHTP